ncbi:DUF4198 domain-containing protein [Shewanella yunxiaonensis]|uniref:DUF4198 domain-containing protein n=1 Tax=Shewanella yunxiaonensis TaxID=2829809 RepID=A0ABX7YWS2_9GAMM|nr:MULTISPECIES: DUF4198 domain-containing protein [Shewanella]MDF0535398.1 DUF4198 domain-containing protein [Shewanella sp. A32]QUN07224.1 DUF4198 domain-containing protein [Shewanella yunxiaonensis]
MLRYLLLTLSSAICLCSFSASAHFQELIPSHDIVSTPAESQLSLSLKFTHPMSRGPLMNMATPLQFGVVGPQGRQNLLDTLQAQQTQGVQTFNAIYQIKRPGDYLFYLEPAPYWEPAEGKMIVHYTKVVVDAFGMEDNWAAEVGLPVEIVPLTRPFGLWSGNLFQGVVKRQGKPVPFAEVEVEWLNDGSITPPSDPYITQIVHADANGTFSYVMPKAGWWGFAALLDGKKPMKNPQGKEVPVERGGLIWVFTRDMK